MSLDNILKTFFNSVIATAGIACVIYSTAKNDAVASGNEVYSLACACNKGATVIVWKVLGLCVVKVLPSGIES